MSKTAKTKPGPAPKFQLEILAKLKRRSKGYTTREVSDTFGGTTQNADQALRRMLAKKLLTKKKEMRGCEGAAGPYQRSTIVYFAAPRKA